MKSKMFSFRLLALHGIVLAAVLMTQGCATGKCPACWLYWPYGAPIEEPLIIDAPIDYTIDSTESIFLPPDMDYTAQSSYGGIDMPPSAGSVYTVQKGDTLSSIAAMYGTSWKNLAEYNSLTNPNKLVAGQEISIPGEFGAAPVERFSAPSVSTYAAQASAAPVSQGTTYVIQRGDTLSGIANRAGVTVGELKAANAFTSNRIIAGKSLTIPTKGSISVPVTSASAEIDTAVPELAPLADFSVPASTVPTTAAPVYEHVLYPGESLGDVARQFGSTQEEIMILNGITDPDNIKPGTKLLIPIQE